MGGELERVECGGGGVLEKAGKGNSGTNSLRGGGGVTGPFAIPSPTLTEYFVIIIFGLFINYWMWNYRPVTRSVRRPVGRLVGLS